MGAESAAVAKVATSLNISIDTLALVDDQPFELAEVQEAHPSVRVFSNTEIAGLLDHAAFDVPVSDESRSRRKMYKAQVVREETLAATGGDYQAFLRSSTSCWMSARCQMRP